MGKEIIHSHFDVNDFAQFQKALDKETLQLAEYFHHHAFAAGEAHAGFELEAWIINPDFSPAPLNAQVIKTANSPLIVTELAKPNIELNSAPLALNGGVLSSMFDQLTSLWTLCQDAATRHDALALMIGIPPTVNASELTLDNMSSSKRYQALNEQVIRLRHGKPLKVDIEGEEKLAIEHNDVMLESAATSFQIHLQVNQQQAARYYNAAILCSSLMVVATANSPFLFGKNLWSETRIPLFEQSIALKGLAKAPCHSLNRVGFGSGYVKDSLLECFIENQNCFPVILPFCQPEKAHRLAHLRLHNGTIWRWNRPLVGFDVRGKPHIRLENRVVPAGPTVVDTVANSTLFYGLMFYLANLDEAPEQILDFDVAKSNFYASAKYGMDARLSWFGFSSVKASELLLSLIDKAKEGLLRMDLDRNDVEYFLGIIKERVITGQNGSSWQRKCFQLCKRDLQGMTEKYYIRQSQGKPVHEWDF